MSVYEKAIIESLEVYIHTILYIRKLYPEPIFRRRKIYGIPIHVSIYPAINNYLVMVLKTAKYLMSEKKLDKLEILFYRNSRCGEERFESYCFEFDFTIKRKSDKDIHLYDFEDAMRKSLLLLEESIRGVGRLPPNARFKILLHTTRLAYLTLNEKPELCDFLWYRDEPPNDMRKRSVEDRQILPLTGVDDIGLQFYMERITIYNK